MHKHPKLSILIDMEKSQRLLDSFCDAVRIAAAIIDLEGEVLVGSRWQQICTDFHRMNDRTCKKCIESDTQLANELQQGKHFSIYQCRNGLTDAASPIIIKGEHVANIFVGQFLLKTPDRDFFLQQAATYGFEETDYLHALSKVPIVMEENLPAILNFVTTFAEMVAIMGIDRLKQIEAVEALQESEEQHRTLVYNLPVAVYRNTPGPEGEFLMANPAFCKMFGFKDEEEVKDISPASIYQNPKERKEYSDNLIQKRVIRNDERTLLKRDGTPVYTSITSRVVYGKDGEVSHFDSIMLDITEQKLAEESLRESEQKYRSLFEESRDAIVLTTQQGKVIDANPAALELFGYTKEEILKMNFQKMYVDPDEGYRFQKEMKEKDSVQGLETKLRRKDGAEMDCIFDVVCRQGDDGKILKYQGIIRDISEAKRAQENLKTSEQRLSQIINFLPDATFVIDNEGRVVTWNHAIERMTEIKAEDMLGKGNYEYALPFYGERRPVLIDLVSRWDRETAGQYQYVKKQGEALVSETYDCLVKPGGFLRNKASLLYDRNGEAIGAIESVRDISERKKSEEALRESEEKYRTILENVVDGYYEVDIAGNFTFFNDSLCEILGYSKNDLMGMNNRQYTDEGNARKLYQTFNRVYTTGKPDKGFHWPVIRKDGTKRIVEASVSLRKDAEDDPIGFRGIVRDISEKQKLETQLQQAQKMEAIVTLAGGVAHEFNNALMGIVGNMELLKMDLPEDERRDKYFNSMKSASYRMSRLTDQLLAYAQGGKYQPKDLKLDDFVIQTLPILQYDLKPAIRVETHFEKDIPYIKADYTQMQMVLSAILANSNEAIEDEGFIRITAENKDLDVDFTKQYPGLKPGLYVCLTVEDDGKGMDEEIRSGIFEPFFTTKFQGRGMGMAAVYGIVKNHDGWIYVYSELGKGTTVRIYLPAISAESREGAKAGEQPEIELGTGEGTILVIEDEEVVIEVTQTMLERLGYRVMVARTGKAAIHIAETFDGRIDLALLDIKLPDIEGGKVYPLIMKARPDLKVIVFSGFAIEGPARQILNAGAQDFIQKPFSLATLSEKLKKVLEGK